MGWGRAAGALIAVLISCALIDVARGGDLVECEPQRVTGGYWAYRIIDGRECWYQGQPGKPKNELFWARAPSARQPMDHEAETQAEPPDPSSRLMAAPPEKPETIEAMPGGGDLVECEPQRVTGGYWAYRIIDGRECWYQGQPGKPKNELFWARAPSAPQPMDHEAENKAEPPDPSVAAPPQKPETIEAMPETAADQLLAFTCCWPELEEPAPLPQPTQESAPLLQPTQEPQAWLLALLPLGLYALWWIARPRRALRAVRAQHAGRVAAAQPHPPAPAMHTGPKESATSLFVPPTNEQQYILLENLVGWHLTQWLDQGAREDAGAEHATSSLESLVEWHLTQWLDQGARSRLVTEREREPAL
jgi:hypothetical protein